MISDFSGFTKGVIGKRLPSDSTLNNMKKSDLIELLHLAEHNYNALKFFYDNVVRLNVKLQKQIEEGKT